MTAIELKFYSDPGHAWMHVRRSLLVELGLEDKISGYSYQAGGDCYLEEDCDAPLVIDALKERGIEFRVTGQHTDNDSPIRGYRRFKAREAA
jgi:hypothetical protein